MSQNAAVQTFSEACCWTPWYFLIAHEDTVLTPILALIANGGPDHRLQYLRTQILMICFFLNHYLDYIIAVYRAAYQSPKSWSIVNFTLQVVVLMRQSMVEEFEKMMSGKNSPKIRELAKKHPDFKRMHLQRAWFNYARCYMLNRLDLKGKLFLSMESGTDENLRYLVWLDKQIQLYQKRHNQALFEGPSQVKGLPGLLLYSTRS